MSDDNELREMAREAIRAGRLPDRAPDHIWGGPSVGGHCVVCQAALQRGAVELEIEFVAEDRSGSQTYQLHVRCFTALECERRARIEGANTPGSSTGAPE